MTTNVNLRGQRVSPSNYSCLFMGIVMLILFLSGSAMGQKNKNQDSGTTGNGTKDLIVRACVEPIGNGLMNVQFGYDNPNNKELILTEDGSYVLTNNGKRKSKAVNYFKKGTVDYAFSKQVSEKEYVEWTVINPNGKTHTVVASANTKKCLNTGGGGVIFPVYGNGRSVVTDQALTALGAGNGGETPSPLVYSLRERQVLVEVVYEKGQLEAAINLLQTTFGFDYNPDPALSDFLVDPDVIRAEQLPTIEGWCDISLVLNLNQYPEVFKFVRTLYPVRRQGGLVTSQGVASLGVDVVQESFRTVDAQGNVVPVIGKDIIVCTISDSYNNSGIDFASVDIANGDLGEDTRVLKEGFLPGTIDEGRAMMQHIYDVAPGVTQLFHTGLTPLTFLEAMETCAAEGAHIINDDLTHMTMQFFGSDLHADFAREFSKQEGKFVMTSSANFGDDGYQSGFVPSQEPFVANFLPPGSPAVAHVFGTNPDGSEDVMQRFEVLDGERQYQISIQYGIISNGFETYPSQGDPSGAVIDLDFLIVDDFGNILVDNTDNNIDRDPSEIITFRSNGAGSANIMVIAPNGIPAGINPSDIVFRYVIFEKSGLQVAEYFSGGPTITGKAMDPSVVAVGAYDYNTGAIESFSALGGTLLSNQVLQPAFAFPNRAEVNIQGNAFPDIDGNGFQEFFGTSAAVPHAAASVALILSTRPGWGEIPGSANGLTNDVSENILQLIKNTAEPAGNPLQSGAGRANMLEVFKSLAVQVPVLTALVVEEGITPGFTPFEVTIIGRYLPEEPRVVLGDDLELQITEVVKDESGEVIQIKAIVPEFIQNPGLQVGASEGKTPTGQDNQLSDPLFFYDDGVAVLTVRPDTTVITYGQTPASYTIKVDGLAPGVDFTSLGLPEVVFSTTASFPYPDVNNYLLTASFAEPLTPEQEALFKVNFKPSLLQVKRLDVTVSYEDFSAVYGEILDPEPVLDFDITGIADPEDFRSYLLDNYASTFYPENTLLLINRFRASVNGFDLTELFENGSWIASENIILNRFRAVPNGLNFLDLDIENFENYTEALSDVTSNRFRAVPNRFRAVANAADLFNGNLDLSIENIFRAVPNSSGIGGEGDENTYENIFVAFDVEDADESVDQVYSINLLTGISVGEHLFYPGAFISPVGRFNLNVSYQSATVEITPATLQVSIENILFDETIDTSAIIYSISGYEYDEDESIFADGVQFRFVDANGAEYQEGDFGVYQIIIEPPNNNYLVEYIQEGYAFFNADYDRKIRTYTDCVEADESSSDGYDLIANFRYINPNDVPVYILEGEENFIQGDYLGELPEVFLPGENTFQVRFRSPDVIKWTLISGGSANSTSSTSSASLNSNRCGSGVLGDDILTIYPNPVQTTLTVQKNTETAAEILIIDTYGLSRFEATMSGASGEMLNIDMTSFANGIYVLQCIIEGTGYTYQVKKE